MCWMLNGAQTAVGHHPALTTIRWQGASGGPLSSMSHRRLQAGLVAVSTSSTGSMLRNRNGAGRVVGASTRGEADKVGQRIAPHRHPR